MTEEVKKEKGHKPKMFTQADMEGGLKAALSKRPEQQSFSMKPIVKNPEKKFSFGGAPSMKTGAPKPWAPYKATPKPEEKPEPEEQPNWTAGEWEDWAVKLYESFPEAHKFLPKWVLDSIKDES